MKILIILQFFFLLGWSHPFLKNADSCHSNLCRIEDDCRCSSTINPIDNPNDPSPQFIAFTVSESIVEPLYEKYLRPLFFHRRNPDGHPIGLSFYVNHEYTDYRLVRDLYNRGYEIGVHSITKNSSQEYWRHASFDDLVQEFDGQRKIISRFANIPIEDIKGVRTPQLQLEGDLSINAYVRSGLSYDNSWPSKSIQPLLPYTLDYASTQSCDVSIRCPKQPHHHFWVAPITDIKGKNGIECNSLVTCLEDGSPQEIASWLLGQVDHMSSVNRAPLVLRLDSYWFQFNQNSFEGFKLFLDQIANRRDIFLVSIGDILEWIKHPVPVSNYITPFHKRYVECYDINCVLNFESSDRYMGSCVPCPEVYPWKGNPYGNYTG